MLKVLYMSCVMILPASLDVLEEEGRSALLLMARPTL